MTDAPGAITVAEAVERLAAGQLVGVPTETEWGLAADAGQSAAIERLFRWKGRAAGQPVSVLVSGPDRAAQLGALDEDARRLMAAFWPGPLTLVVRGAAGLAPGVLSQAGGLGLRCSAHPVARSLTAAAEARGLGPITATSLNRSGAPGAASRSAAERAVAERNDDAPALLEGECSAGAPSTVVDCTGPRVRLLREGEFSRAALSAVTRLPVAEVGEESVEAAGAAATSHC